MSYRGDKQKLTQTDTHTQTQAMTIPVGQRALGKNKSFCTKKLIRTDRQTDGMMSKQWDRRTDTGNHDIAPAFGQWAKKIIIQTCLHLNFPFLLRVYSFKQITEDLLTIQRLTLFYFTKVKMRTHRGIPCLVSKSKCEAVIWCPHTKLVQNLQYMKQLNRTLNRILSQMKRGLHEAKLWYSRE